ncbi:MAG: hypothetical protein ACI35S_03800 [Anaeroplasma sp.]
MDNDYLEIRKKLTKFIEKNYWERFTSADFFYMTDENFSKKRIMIFLDLYNGVSHGINLFFNRDGLNYLHDFFSLDEEETNTADRCDCISAFLFDKRNLTDEDIKYLKEKKTRIKEKNNLVILRFQKGFICRYANEKEEKKFLDNLYFLDDLIKNEFNDIIEAFNSQKSVLSCVDELNRRYSVMYDDLPYLETKPRKNPINQQFYDEFKEHSFIDDECECKFDYLPFSIGNVKCNVLFFDYLKSRIRLSKSFISKPIDLKKYVWSIFDEIFNEQGIPYRIVFNNRDVYYTVLKTFEKLNIECILDNKIVTFDEVTRDIINFTPRVVNSNDTELFTIKLMEILNAKMNLDEVESLVQSLKYDKSDEDYKNEDDSDLIS